MFVLLVAFLVAAITHTTLDAPVVLAFLSIAFALLFGPTAGYYFLVRKNGNGNGGKNGSSH